ncbi:uncharacterized protein [Amphiura filiformis]|uniref:uncharacterized protein isoform X2 n=1 Tax=Amphiura filiformis TaxID=82378 RepID=UPI003B20D37D
MDWRRELITKWLWHAYNGFVESENEKNTEPSGADIDVSQLKLLTAHIGTSLGTANNSPSSINADLEKHFKEKQGHVSFQDYLEFLHVHTFIEPDLVDLQKLEESCWSLCQKTYGNRVNKVLDMVQTKRIWKLFNFLSEADESPCVMCREETQLLMEKLILGTGNRWDPSTFDYHTKNIKSFAFLQIMACFETNYAKGMDRMCVSDSVDDLYDTVIEQCEKKGWMIKKGNNITKWKDRWFILKKDGMYYYTDKSATPKTQKGMIKLDKAWSSESLADQPNAKHKNVFTLARNPVDPKQKSHYELSTTDPRSRAQWIAAVNAVINSANQDSIHRTELQERRRKRQEAKDKEKAEQDSLQQQNIDMAAHQMMVKRLEEEKAEALRKLQLEEEERHRLEEEEQKFRKREEEERIRIQAEMERLKKEREEAEQHAQNEAAMRIQKEQEELERQLREQEERDKQQAELDELRRILEEEKLKNEEERERLEEALRNLERLLAAEIQAKKDEEEIRTRQARLLEEEAERRKELEKLKEEQEKQLAEETERRKGLEQQSEQLATIQKEQAEQLRKEQEKLQKLSDERKAADAQLQEAKVKLEQAETARAEQEAEKLRREEEIKKKKEERKRELDKRVNIGLAKPLQVKVTKLTSHRGEGAFTEAEFDIIKEIKAKEKELSQKLSLSISEDEDLRNGSQANGENEVFKEELEPVIE